MPGKPHTPFRSKAQWRYFAVNKKLRRFFHEKAVATTGTSAHGTPQGRAAYARLPRRKRAPGARSVR